MINLRPVGTTRTLGKSQGYLGLNVLDEHDTDGFPIMTSSWEPTPAELERLNAGAPVLLRVFAVAHPPVKLEVGPVPA